MPDREDRRLIRDFLESLRHKPWLKETQKYWPRFLVHVTSLENVPGIFQRRALLSRIRGDQEKLIRRDNASPNVIGATPTLVQDYARLYFRPRVPTFFRNEGFRPKHRQWMGAHCAVPVALLFDAVEVLSLPEAEICLGSAYHFLTTDRGSGIDCLATLDFREIYHSDPLMIEDKQRIINARHTEVLIPGELNIRHLKFVLTRSQAELQTLKSILGDIDLGDIRLLIAEHEHFFYQQWLYVEHVVLYRNKLTFTLNPDVDLSDRGPFNVLVEVENFWGVYRYNNEDFHMQRDHKLVVDVSGQVSDFPMTVTMTIDGVLAYKYTFEEPDDPWLLDDLF